MRLALITLAAVLACSTAPAFAQQCPPLRRAFALDLTPEGSYFGVPLAVNGVPKKFVLSTGDFASRLSRETVTELKLTPRTEGNMLSYRGTMRNAQMVSADLQIGPIKATRQELYVADGTAPFDGMFGPNLMQNYDIEFDFTGRKLSYFLTDHCEGRVVHWTMAPYAVVPFTGWNAGSAQETVTIPVRIDGREVRAEIDTLLTRTVMDADTANSLFGLTPDSEGVALLGTPETNPERAFTWTFKELQIGELTIPKPRMVVEPDRIGTRTRDTLEAGSRVLRRTDNFLPSMRLGMDVLRRLHLYLATREGKLYLTPASAK